MSSPYVPNFRSGFESLTLPAVGSPSIPLSGVGAPDGVVVGIPGQTYTDLDTNNLYIKMGGNQALGWQLIGIARAGGSGCSGTSLIYGSGDPNGVFAATWPAIFYGDNGSVWVKITPGTTNTGWQNIIAGI